MNDIDTHSQAPVIGVILAGGAGRRLGGVDKGLINLNGQPLIEHVLARLKPQVNHILIIANRHKDSYSEYGHPVISDRTSGFEGPLTGMLAGLHWASEKHSKAQCLFVPVDAPLLPDDLLNRLQEASSESELAAASNAEGIQPVCCLIGTQQLERLEQDFEAGERSPYKWLQNNVAAIADFSDLDQTLWSLNTPEELQTAEQVLRTYSGQAA